MKVSSTIKGRCPAPARGLDRDLIAVRQHVRHAAAAAILDVVVDWVVVAAGCLKGEEDRLGL